MRKSRRNFVVGSVLAAGAASFPAVRYAKWSKQSFERRDYSERLSEVGSSNDSWMNWSGLHRVTPVKIAEPENEIALQELLSESSHPIRPLGSGHSFSPLVPSEGTMISLSRFNGLRSYDLQNRSATIGAGTTLMQAARELNAIGLAFPNLPDIDVQTLAGSFSTATHGTGRELSALHDYVTQFKIATANGEMITVDHDSNPSLFNAGKVSLGVLGIIVEYTLKLQPSFSLRRRVWLEPVDELLEKSEELSRQFRNYEFFYFPGTGYAAGITHEIHSGPVTGRAQGEDDDLLDSLKELRDVFGWFPWLRRKLFERGVSVGLVEDSTDESWRLLSTHRPTRFQEIEYNIPVEKGIEVVREIIRLLDRRSEVFFPIEARYIAQDKAWLSPFNDGPRFAISVHAAVNERFDYFFDELEPMFRKFGGRPHWGKLHGLSYDDFSIEYPSFKEFVNIQQGLDPEGKFLNPYLAKILGFKE